MLPLYFKDKAEYGFWVKAEHAVKPFTLPQPCLLRQQNLQWEHAKRAGGHSAT